MSTEKRDRQKANRAAKFAAQRAAARARHRKRVTWWATAAVVAIAAIWGFVRLTGGEEGASSSTVTTAAVQSEATPATDYDGYLAQATACGGGPPPTRTEMTFDAAQDQALTGQVSVSIQTSCGPIEIALDAEAYPETVNSFVFLALEGFYAGTACHRISPGFMVQCGDPTATGSGDAGYTVPDEFPGTGFTYERGVVAMANAGAGTTGSQFFIVTGDASHLDPIYSILGTVVGGEDTLDAIEQIPVTARAGEVSNPTESLYIESIDVG